MLLPLLIGFAFGFIGSMPVAGPISVLVLHLGLAHQARHALFVAAGGALAEGLYALLAFWGLSAVLARYPMVLPVSRVVGAFLLLGIGLAMLLARARAAAPRPQAPRRGNKRSFALGFLITALNPTLIITWTTAVTALNATGLLSMDRAQAPPFAAAVCFGIVAWFFTLLALVGRWRNQVSVHVLERLKRVMGTLLVGIGGWILVRGLANLLRSR
ncbi:MAG: LysE family transporter [Holophaga sp.]|nr:LysE family transporter [Holophaga sp.]